MKLKSFFLRMSISIVILLMATDLFAQTGYAAPGGTWIPASKSWRGSTTTQGTDPWTLTPRTGLIDEPFPGVGTDSVVRQVFPQYYIKEKVQGYLEYLPSGYNLPQNSTKLYPLIIYVPGCGEMHDGRVYVHSNGNPNWNYGIFRLMKTDGGTSQFPSLPRELVRNGDYFSAIPLKTPGQAYGPYASGPKQGVIVMALSPSHRRAAVCGIADNIPGQTNPDYHATGIFDVDEAITVAKRNYRVDPTRIYITGMSKGAAVSYDYVSEPSFPDFPRKVAGILPVCASDAILDQTKAAFVVNNGVNVLAVVNRYDWGSSVIYNNRTSIQNLKNVAGVGPTQIDSFFFLENDQLALNPATAPGRHSAWPIAYQTRYANDQNRTPGRWYVWTDPTNGEQYTAYEWMLSKQNLTLLPVQVSSFTAIRENNGVKLDWSTSTEVNSDKFILERSTNGSSFNLLTEIKAAGNSNTTIRYSHLDANLPNSTYVYYRLSQRDKNGKLHIIGIKKIYLGNQGYEISMYPSVVTTSMNIEIQGTVNEQITVQVVDMAGRRLSQHVIAPRQNRLTINTDKLSKGMYIVQISGGGKTQTSKFIKQ